MTEDAKPREVGHLAWVETVKGAVKYMQYRGRALFPASIQWTEKPGEATFFDSPDYPVELMEQLLNLPKRRFMGMIFPAIEVAVAFDLPSTANEFDLQYGVSPVYLQLIPDGSKAVRRTAQVKSEVDPDGVQSTPVSMRGEKQ